MSNRQEINLEIEDDCIEAVGHPDNSTPENNLTKQINFLTKKIEKSLNSIFELDTTITNLIIKRLPSYNDHVPYESLAGKYGAKPTVAILSLGAPRSLKLRRGTKITHLVPMHSGSLCVLSGNSTLEYMHSIPKGKSDIENEQLVLFFIGSPSTAIEETCDQTSVSYLSERMAPSESTDGGSSSAYYDQLTSDVERDNEIHMPLNTATDNPGIIITPTSPPNTNLSEAQTSDSTDQDIISPSATHASLLLNMNDDINFGPATPEDTERTVILVDNHTVPPETFMACVAHLPEPILNEELARNGCSTEGSVTERRTIMTKLISRPGEPARSTLNKDLNSKIPSLAWVQTIIENQVIDIKQELENLSSEVNSLKCSDTSIQQVEKLLEVGKKEMQKIKDLWEKNLSATTRIKNRVDEVFTEIDIAETKTDVIDKSVQKLKFDLKNYYNSAFFREDGQLIKEIHKTVTQSERWNGVNADGPPVYSPNDDDSSHTPPYQLQPPSPFRDPRTHSRENDLLSRRGNGFSMTPAVPRHENSTARSWNPPERFNNPTRIHENNRQNTIPPSKVFKTTLISDSILRHVQSMDTKNALGKNHELNLINKRDTSGLKDQHVKDELLRTKPDFIYVHLGVNDVNQRFDLRTSLDNIFQFSLFVEESLKDSKLFFSMPLMTSDNDANERIGELRDAIWEFVTVTNRNERKPFKERSLYYNPNANFMKDNQLVREYLMDDGVHPSTRGKEVILGNLRHSIHEMTRLLLNKPKKTRLTGGLEPPHSRT